MTPLPLARAIGGIRADCGALAERAKAVAVLEAGWVGVVVTQSGGHAVQALEQLEALYIA